MESGFQIQLETLMSKSDLFIVNIEKLSRHVFQGRVDTVCVFQLQIFFH